MSGITSFVTIATASGLSTAHLMTKPQFSNWVNSNRSMLTIAGNTYIAKGTTPTLMYQNFSNIVGSNNPASNGFWNLNNTNFYSNTTPIPPGRVLRDMGQDVYIGVPGQANMLHLRLVTLPGGLTSLGGPGTTGYVVVETNANIFTGVGYPNTSVARA